MIQFLNLVYRYFNLEIYSFLNKTAILVNKAVLDDITMPADGLINDRVELVFVEPAPPKISVKFKYVFFVFKLFYFFFRNSFSILRDYIIDHPFFYFQQF